MCPASIIELPARIPIIARLVTDLPEPDSPTIHSVSPFLSSKLTPLTALTIPLGVLNEICKFSTLKIVSSLCVEGKYSGISNSVSGLGNFSCKVFFVKNFFQIFFQFLSFTIGIYIFVINQFKVILNIFFNSILFIVFIHYSDPLNEGFKASLKPFPNILNEIINTEISSAGNKVKYGY